MCPLFTLILTSQTFTLKRNYSEYFLYRKLGETFLVMVFITGSCITFKTLPGKRLFPRPVLIPGYLAGLLRKSNSRYVLIRENVVFLSYQHFFSLNGRFLLWPRQRWEAPSELRGFMKMSMFRYRPAPPVTPG